MSGNPENTDFWPEGDVYVSFDLEAEVPETIDDDFSADWFLVGLLDGDDGFTETSEWGEDSDHYAWGGVLIGKTRGKYKYAKKFSALERNYATDRLRWPGSTVDNLTVPQIEPVLIAFETSDGTDIRRVISSEYAEVMPAGDLNENEKDPTKWEFEATFFPDGDGVFAIRQESNAVSSS